MLSSFRAGLSQQPTSSQWQGFLRNAAGAPIAGAKVRLAPSATASSAASAEDTTAADGQFHLAPLPAGAYRLTVSAEGHAFDYAQPIDLTLGAPPVSITLS